MDNKKARMAGQRAVDIAALLGMGAGGGALLGAGGVFGSGMGYAQMAVDGTQGDPVFSEIGETMHDAAKVGTILGLGSLPITSLLAKYGKHKKPAHTVYMGIGLGGLGAGTGVGLKGFIDSFKDLTPEEQAIILANE